MADEPVKLKDLIQSLASTMVVTSHYLDQANVDLRNQYALSGDGALASLAPPRFALDEMTIDLSFVVEEAAVVASGRKPTPPTEGVFLTDNQRLGMMKKLEVLAEFERGMAGFEAQRDRLGTEISAARRKDQVVTRSLGKTRAEIKTDKARLQLLGSNPFTSRQRLQLQTRIAAKEVQLGVQGQQQAAIRQNISTLTLRRAALEPPPKPPSVVAGPQPPELLDYAKLWNDFEKSYEALKTAYDEAVVTFDAGRSQPRIGRFGSLAGELGPALVRGGVAPTTREKVEKIRTDFAATQTALGDLVALIAALKGEGIKVRVDPESISQATEAARQRVRLTFRAESQETVQVEGEERDLP